MVSEPQIDGDVKVFVLSSMCPWLVPESTNARFGSVSVGTEPYQWSHTAKPLASAESTGSASGVKQPMMSCGCVPLTMDQPCFCSQPMVYA